MEGDVHIFAALLTAVIGLAALAAIAGIALAVLSAFT